MSYNTILQLRSSLRHKKCDLEDILDDPSLKEAKAAQIREEISKIDADITETIEREKCLLC